MTATPANLVERYLELGLRLGRHIDGMVDAYYGPAALSASVDAEPLRTPAALAEDAKALVADLDAGVPLDAATEDSLRRRWLRAQVLGLRTTAERLAGVAIAFEDEIERCYGVRPTRVDESAFEAAHRALDEVLPGTGPLGERYIEWKEAQSVPTDVLPRAIASFAEDFRDRTQRAFGLPEGEHIDFDLVTNEPWSGFNYYLGDLKSRVAINIDLPVLATSLGHLVAHEAYPGHHTEHSRKEVGLVRRRQRLEESIFLVGAPQCLLAEGLADLGLEVLCGERPEAVEADHLKPLGIPFDAEVAARARQAAEALNAVRGNLALLLHVDGADPDDVIAYAERWGLLPKARAEKAVQFQTDPTWRAYIFCYIDGLRLCRRFTAGDPARFERLLTEQLLPADLEAARPEPGAQGVGGVGR
ncbi:MAG: DUF885 domain-containing protein [Acidimicrobiia bacterium]|nr:DUF885 domain-containing protein [Acidimicrobiia bacterium]